MSWLNKVSEFAGKAEDLLIRFDQNTSTVIQEQKSKIKSTALSQTNFSQQDVYGEMITEDVGRREPSHAHSDYIRPPLNKQPAAGYAPSTSVLPEKRDAHLISFLNEKDPTVDAVRTDEPSYSRRESQNSTSFSDESSLLSNLRSQLSAKDSQLFILKAQLTDMEEKLEKERRAEEKRQGNDGSNVALEKQRGKEEREWEKEREQFQRELQLMKKKLQGMEEQLTQSTHQLHLAKFNLTENKKEFDLYKEKAQKVLQTKERLIESLKAEDTHESKSSNVVMAELEELRVERDLARGDLESAQVQLYNLRAELEEAESISRQTRTEREEERKRHAEEIEQWAARYSVANEKAECARMEIEFARGELTRQRENFAARLDQLEAELANEKESGKRARRFDSREEGEEEGKLANLLIAKEEELRTAIKEKQVLSLRLERALHAQETSIPMDGSSENSRLLGGVANGASPAHSLVSSLLGKGLSLLRVNQTARMYFFVYLLAIHILLFFIILTYTPEIHQNIPPTSL